MKVKCFQNTWSILRRAIYGNDSSFVLIKRYNHRVNPQHNSKSMLKTSLKKLCYAKFKSTRKKKKEEKRTIRCKKKTRSYDFLFSCLDHLVAAPTSPETGSTLTPKTYHAAAWMIWSTTSNSFSSRGANTIVNPAGT